MGLQSFGIDVLHTIHLGILQNYILRVIWLCIKTDAFNTQCIRRPERIRASMKVVVSKLKKGTRRMSSL